MRTHGLSMVVPNGLYSWPTGSSAVKTTLCWLATPPFAAVASGRQKGKTFADWAYQGSQLDGWQEQNFQARVLNGVRQDKSSVLSSPGVLCATLVSKSEEGVQLVASTSAELLALPTAASKTCIWI